MTIMTNIDFKFKDEEGVTLQWMTEGSRVGYIRIHKDVGRMPGPTTYSCAIEVYNNNKYEFKLLKKLDEKAENNLRTKLAPLVRYLHSLGYKGDWTRFHEDSEKEVAISEMHFEGKDSKGESSGNSEKTE